MLLWGPKSLVVPWAVDQGLNLLAPTPQFQPCPYAFILSSYDFGPDLLMVCAKPSYDIKIVLPGYTNDAQ